MAQLWIEEKFDLGKNPNMVILKHPLLSAPGFRPTMIHSPMEEDFTMSVNNTYASEQGLMDATVEKGANLVNHIASVFGNSKVGTKTIRSTLLEWQDASYSDFNLTFLFPTLKESDDVIGVIKSIVEVTAPENLMNGQYSVLMAPGGYNTYDDARKKMTDTISLGTVIIPGTWTLIIPGMCLIRNLVAETANIVISKDRLFDGKPLWAKVTFNLKPALQPTKEDYLKWFTDSPNYSTSNNYSDI